MEQRTGVLYDNALEPSSLKYNLWIISLSTNVVLWVKKVKYFWEVAHTLSPILGTRFGN